MSLFASTPHEQRLALRVGLFVFIALVLAGLVVFFIGRETRLFERRVVYRTYFENVEGLAEGAPVWLGGLEVGRVEAITFPSQPGQEGLEVRLEVSARHAERVREDSVARLSSLGVLGDKAVDISLGSGEAPRLPPGSAIPGVAGGDLSSLLRGASQVMEESVAITRTLRAAVETYGDPELAQEVAESVRSLSALLREIAEGEGVLHALIYDEQAGRQVRRLLSNASQAAARMDQSLAEVEALLEEVRTGQGSLHALIYEPQGAQALSQLGSAADELAKLLAEARTNPESALHQVLYGESGDLFADLGTAAENVREITDRIARGEGSLGGIINDSTLYEDLRTIVGNIRRNKLLRALVRYTVRRREDLDEVGQPRGPIPEERAPEQGTGGAGTLPPREPLPLLPQPGAQPQGR